MSQQDESRRTWIKHEEVFWRESETPTVFSSAFEKGLAHYLERLKKTKQEQTQSWFETAYQALVAFIAQHCEVLPISEQGKKRRGEKEALLSYWGFRQYATPYQIKKSFASIIKQEGQRQAIKAQVNKLPQEWVGQSYQTRLLVPSSCFVKSRDSSVAEERALALAAASLAIHDLKEAFRPLHEQASHIKAEFAGRKFTVKDQLALSLSLIVAENIMLGNPHLNAFLTPKTAYPRQGCVWSGEADRFEKQKAYALFIPSPCNSILPGFWGANNKHGADLSDAKTFQTQKHATIYATHEKLADYAIIELELKVLRVAKIERGFKEEHILQAQVVAEEARALHALLDNEGFLQLKARLNDLETELAMLKNKKITEIEKPTVPLKRRL